VLLNSTGNSDTSPGWQKVPCDKVKIDVGNIERYVYKGKNSMKYNRIRGI